MKSIDQVSRGVADYYDVVVRPTLTGGKAILYGLAVGRAASRAREIVGRYEDVLTMLGVYKDGMLDVEGLAAEMRAQMNKNGGVLIVPIGKDEFRFKPEDVDELVRHIEKA
jgi:hypothetical protein